MPRTKTAATPAATAPAKVSGKAAIEQVLADGKTHKASEIISRAVELATELNGKTPKATLSAMLVTEANRPGGRWKRVAPGTYKRAPVRKAVRA